MAKTITELTAAGAVAGADLLWLEQSGLPRKVTMTEIATYTGGGGGLDDGTVTGSGLVWDGAAWVEADSLGNIPFRLDWTGTNQLGELQISSDAGGASLSMVSNALGSGAAAARHPRFNMLYVVAGTDPELTIGLNQSAGTDAIGDTFTDSTSTNWGINAKGSSAVGLEIGKGEVSMRIDQNGIKYISAQSASRYLTQTSSLIPSTFDWNFAGHSGWAISGIPVILHDGTLKLEEQAAAEGDTANYGQIWVKNDTPNTLWFTDDAGTDVQLGVGSGIGGSITDNQIAVGAATADSIEGGSNLTFNGTTLDVGNGSNFIALGGTSSGHSNYLTLGKGFDIDSGIRWSRGAIIDSRIYVNASENMIFTIDEGNTLSGNVFTWQANGAGSLMQLNDSGNLDVTGGIDVTGNITVTGTVDTVDVAAFYANMRLGGEFSSTYKRNIVQYNRWGANQDMGGTTNWEEGVYGGYNTMTNGPTGMTYDPFLVMGSASDVRSFLVVPRTASRALAYKGSSSSGTSHTAWHYALWSTTAPTANISATPAELNLLDLSGLTAGWVLSADSATTASWKAPTGTVSGTGTDNTIATWNGTTAINTDANSFLIANAVDKTAAETIAGDWTFEADTGNTSIVMQKTTATNFAGHTYTNELGVTRWLMATAATTDDDFVLYRYTDAGAFNGIALSVDGATGQIDLNYASSATKLSVVTDGINVTGTMAATTVTGANVTSGVDPGHTHTNYLISNEADIKTSGELRFNDNINLEFGNSNDASVFFNGATTFNIQMENGVNFLLRGGISGGDPMIAADSNSRVELYWDGAVKLQTATTGVDITGTMAATTVTGANVTSGSNPGHTHTGSSISGLDAGDTTTGTFALARIPESTINTSGVMHWDYASAACTSGTYYTIATDPTGLDITAAPTGVGGSRAEATFIVYDTDSGLHSFCEFKVSITYGRRPAITILNKSSYGNDNGVVRGIRLVHYSTYDGCAVQVLAGSTGTMRVKMRTTQQSGGFILKTPVAQTPHATFYLQTMDLNSYATNIGFAVGVNSEAVGSNTDFEKFLVTPGGIEVNGTVTAGNTFANNSGTMTIDAANGIVSVFNSGFDSRVRAVGGAGGINYTEIFHDDTAGWVYSNVGLLYVNGATDVRIRTGNNDTKILCTNGAGVEMRHNTTAVLQTKVHNGLDDITGLEVKNFDGNMRDVGLATMEAVAKSSALTISETHIHKTIRITNVTGNITFANDSGMAVDSVGWIINTTTSDQVLAATSDNLEVFAGDGVANNTGNMTLAGKGWCTWRKLSDTEYELCGIGLS